MSRRRSYESFGDEFATTSVAAEVANCSRLNVRSAPSIDSSVIEILASGDKVVINLTFMDDDFYAVLTPSGKHGYLMKKYLKIMD